MAAATVDDITRWFKDGKKNKMDYLIVVCDTYDYEDFPVLVTKDNFEEEYQKHNGKNMQTIMEVYDLNKDMNTQMAEHRAFNYPAGFNPHKTSRKE